MRSVTIAVIGHVDHGKTLLVHALTGVDTDTLKDEKARGLSIALGFAGLSQDSCNINLIDAPGHVDFTRMTASGLSGASAILLVVSARDGIQKQTIEHVNLAHLFGIDQAVVAITKTDLVEGENTAALHAQVSKLLSEFGFQSSKIVDVSGRTGVGLNALIVALTGLAKVVSKAPVLKGFFLPIDRVFSADGAGTIITGTLLGGSLKIDQEVSLLPLGRTTSARGLEADRNRVAAAEAGTRIAVNLRAIETKDIRKGDVLCAPGDFASTKRFDVRLTSTNALEHMQHVEVLFGTSHAAARVRLYAAENAKSGYAQLEFEKPQVAYQSQRFVLRDPASAQTLCGGIILDPQADLILRKKAAHILVLQAAETKNPLTIANAIADRDHGLVDVASLSRLCSTSFECADIFEPRSPNTLVRVSDREALQTQIVSNMHQMHAARPCRPFIDPGEIETPLRPAPKILIDAACERLVKTGQIRRQDAGLTLADHDPISGMTTQQIHLYRSIEDRSKAFGVRPKNLFETPTLEQTDLIECLIWKGRLVSLYNHSLKRKVLLHTDVIQDAGALLAQTFANEQSFTTSLAREVLGANRKTIVPLLEHFDRIQFTRRSGNLRSIISDTSRVSSPTASTG
ncbi:MAG: selenocysteine-specific translation elongation factor [Pseudomonadota bacterium]